MYGTVKVINLLLLGEYFVQDIARTLPAVQASIDGTKILKQEVHIGTEAEIDVHNWTAMSSPRPDGKLNKDPILSFQQAANMFNIHHERERNFLRQKLRMLAYRLKNTSSMRGSR